MLENFISFILENSYRMPDLFFGLVAILGGLSFISIIITLFIGNGKKGSIRYMHLSFWMGLMMVTPSIMYYAMIIKFGYDRWVSAFAGIFLMFILSQFVQRVALSDEGE